MGEITRARSRRKTGIRSGVTAASITVLVLTGLTFGQPAQAAGHVVGGGAQASKTIERLSVQERQVIAESLGLSLEQASDRFDGQNQFSSAMMKIEEKDPTYSSSQWQRSALAKGWVEFAGEPAAESVSLLQALPFPVEIRTDASATASQIQFAVETTQKQLLTSPGVVDANTWYDQNTKSIQAEVKSTKTPFARTTPAAPTLQSQLGIPVVTRVSNEAGIVQQVARGGVGFSGCTSAFAATKGGLRGILTAGHCGNDGMYLANSGPTQFNSEHQGGYGDFQFNTTNDSLSGSIAVNYEGTAFMAITGQAVAANGATACNYGITRQSWSCAVVQNNSVCSSNLCRLVQTDRRITNPGDSGGPWFSGNTALGIHMGLVGDKSTYSRIGNAEAILGVRMQLS